MFKGRLSESFTMSESGVTFLTVPMDREWGVKVKEDEI